MLFSERRSEEGYMAEKMHNLFRRRAGHISVLTKIYNESSGLITCGKCNVGDILLRLNKFDKAWCEFVDVHEQYLGLVQNETDKQNACASYEEQSKRKTKLDALATEWPTSYPGSFLYAKTRRKDPGCGVTQILRDKLKFVLGWGGRGALCHKGKIF